MAYTTLMYETLVAAIAQGALIVKYGDKEVTYRSLNDMIRIRTEMEKELGLNASKPPSRRYAQHSKGLQE